MGRKTGFVRRHGGMVRETLWAPLPVTVNALAAATSAQLIAQASAAEDALRPYTIIRTHVMISMISDQIVATENQGMAIGFCVVADQASAIGVTAVPTPITDLGSDAWYLHQFLFNEFSLLNITGYQDGGNRVVEVDSKAMRKVEDGFDNIITIQSTTESEGMIVTVAGRQLLKLH